MMVQTDLNQGWIRIAVSFILRSSCDQADEATAEDDKQREVKPRQDLRSAEWHARLRRLQPATHQPKTGSSIGKPNTLVNRVKDASSRTPVTLAHRSNSCDYQAQRDAFLVKRGNECSAEDLRQDDGGPHGSLTLFTTNKNSHPKEPISWPNCRCTAMSHERWLGISPKLEGPEKIETHKTRKYRKLKCLTYQNLFFSSKNFTSLKKNKNSLTLKAAAKLAEHTSFCPTQSEHCSWQLMHLNVSSPCCFGIWIRNGQHSTWCCRRVSNTCS